MRRNALISLALLIFSAAAQAQDLVVHHELDVRVDPETSRVDVTDTISIPDTMQLGDLVFSLHEGLSPQSITRGVRIEEAGEMTSAADKGMDQEDHSSEIRPVQYRIVAGDDFDGRQLAIRYGGILHHPVRQIEQEYARGFSQSPGLVDAQGVYLAGATRWIPSFGEEYVTYTMTVRTPAGWKTVSQGKRSSSADDADGHIDTWVVDTPTEEIFVIAAEFVEYEYAVGNILAMAFLRDKDDGLANKYLETTAQYMEMYQDLLGPYPYSKFALVENFWLRHAVVHPARPAGHPLPVHPALVLPARTAA